MKNNKAFTLDDVLIELQKFVESYPTIKEAALELGVSRVFLWRILNRVRSPSERILEHIGFKAERKIVYEYHKIGA